MLADAFRPAQVAPAIPRSVAFLGLAAGTGARQYRLAFGNQIDITGVEIDPDILAAGHRYFHLDDARAHEVVADARYWLDTQAGHYDVMVLDAYRQPYIPFHLTTREFFQQVKAHLNPGGVIAVNVGRTATDYRLVDALASTMSAVFPSVLLLDDPNYTNTVVYASTEAITVDDVIHNLRLVSAPLAVSAAASALDEGKLRVSPYHGQVYTDDLAPIEQLIDEIIFGYLTNH
jgi:spermidine synthase